MDDEYFLASRWGLPDLHFDKWDDEEDHPWHQLEGLEITEEPPTQKITVGELLIKIKQWDNCYY